VSTDGDSILTGGEIQTTFDTYAGLRVTVRPGSTQRHPRFSHEDRTPLGPGTGLIELYDIEQEHCGIGGEIPAFRKRKHRLCFRTGDAYPNLRPIPTGRRGAREYVGKNQYPAY